MSEMKVNNMYQFMGEEPLYHIFDKTCFHCHEDVFVGVNKEQYYRWFLKREYIQDVFPELSNQLRELLISGTHPECWEKMFEECENEEEEEE